ncbi:hypothetical protein BDM02DRAFT_3131389 [Thelephora ganbajun]|uniref:Uncharacterized protein n=1 Tax=Thelephora ganbajun TaxID=370292 RepID=A0ACB6Z792_THEGA|nr:hypothetical protein BDM02DRAFT_3131389 [Thelephora ganbajun]
MFVGFKRGDISDPFHSHDQLPFEKLFEATCATHGRIVLYSTRLQTYQFRTWAFSVGVFGKVARLFHWDRAGAVVSEPIRYCKRGNRDLAEFLCRFDLMDHGQRGWDHTVFDATPEESVVFDEAIKTVVGEGKNALLKTLPDSVGNRDDYPRRRIEIPTPDDEDDRAVSEREVSDRTCDSWFRGDVEGRGEVGFLKDGWRPDIPGMMGEGHLFGKLEGARNISAFLHGSDVRRVAVRRRDAVRAPGPPTNPLQRTLSDLYSEDYGGPQRMVGYIHYRTVQCEFYVPLNMFKDSKHLTQIIHDIIIGTSLLCTAVDGGDRLIDPDLARDRHEVGARRSVRTGTWQFMSMRLLTTPGKVHELCDCLESLWFVLLYEGLHFVNHNKPRGIKMASVFDHGLMTRMLQFESKPFTALIRQLYLLFKSLDAYYMTQDNDEQPSDSLKENIRKLDSCAEIERLLGEALNSEGWSVSCDKAEDQYPPRKHLTPKQKETVALLYVNCSLVPAGELPGVKRKREEEDDPRVPEIKRPRVNQPLWKRIWSKCGLLPRG